ncbi:MAG: protein phosphatase 2C domain-containing protein [Anaerolineales bacterium]|nr:protein phosphatase 2C domain-containing protein [Anaerolineales bacterium]
MTMQLQSDAQAFMGKRDLLEDRASSPVISTASGLELTLAIVADGMGGEGKGERASTLAIDEFTKSLKRATHTHVPTVLQDALLAANTAVLREVDATPGLNGMGTTFAVAAVHDGKLYIANAGDSRIYLVRNGELTQISRDHTLETKMRLKGRDESYISANRNRAKLTNHIGTPDKFYVDLGLYLDQNAATEKAEQNQGLELNAGDSILVCSDGLLKATREREQAVASKEIVDYIRAFAPAQVTQKLGELAVTRGASDNVSLAVIDTGGKKKRLPVGKPKLGSLAAVGGLAALVLAAFFLFGDRQPAEIPQLEDNFAFVSDLSGNVELVPTGTINSQPLRRSDIFQAGEGATVEVVGSGYLRLGLADNSIISLGDDTKIELRQISSGTQVETIIVLIRGKLLVNANIPDDREFWVRSANGAEARVEGTIMGVFYDFGGQHFQVDCLEGHCVVQDANGNSVDLSVGEYAEIFGLGDVSQIQPARYEFWQDIADRGLVYTPTPTPRGAPTATPQPTATTRSSNATATPILLGCTDQKAQNYNANANTDDGSCRDHVNGCMDPNAQNYNPNATRGTSSDCIPHVLGCTDASGAQNYNPSATKNDGSCIAHILGCMDANAQNYNPSATKDNGSCVPHVMGCMDPNAQNYDPSATKDNGSCVPHILGCMNPSANNFNLSATKDDGSCTFD